LKKNFLCDLNCIESVQILKWLSFSKELPKLNLICDVELFSGSGIRFILQMRKIIFQLKFEKKVLVFLRFITGDLEGEIVLSLLKK